MTFRRNLEKLQHWESNWTSQASLLVNGCEHWEIRVRKTATERASSVRIRRGLMGRSGFIAEQRLPLLVRGRGPLLVEDELIEGGLGPRHDDSLPGAHELNEWKPHRRQVAELWRVREDLCYRKMAVRLLVAATVGLTKYQQPPPAAHLQPSIVSPRHTTLLR